MGLKTTVLSSTDKRKTAKFYSENNGPYIIKKILTTTIYNLLITTKSHEDIEIYHLTSLVLFYQKEDEDVVVKPIIPTKPRR